MPRILAFGMEMIPLLKSSTKISMYRYFDTKKIGGPFEIWHHIMALLAANYAGFYVSFWLLSLADMLIINMKYNAQL